MQSELFSHIVVILLIVTAFLVFFARAGLPSVLGYLAAGIVVGPDAFNLLASERETEGLSEIGIILMMFSIGLDFSWPRLRRSFGMIAGVGFGCVVTVTAAVMGILIYAGVTPAAAFLVGGAVAMSSSAVINKQLMEQKEFDDSHGRMAFGITLFQDFAALVFLAAIPALTAAAGTGGALRGVAVALVTAFAVLAGLWVVGQKVERPLMRQVGLLRSSEIFVLVTLLVILGAAWVSEFFHLPMTIGAFLAGMIIGETEFRHKVEDDIRPFRDLMVGLFFVVMGVSLRLPDVSVHMALLAVVLFGSMALKFVLTAACAYLYKPNLGNSVRVGLVLSSCDELSLMIVVLAMKSGLIGPVFGNVLLAAFVLSLILSTFLTLYNRPIAFFLLRLFGAEARAVEERREDLSGLSDHIILCGFGETGQAFRRMLKETGIPLVAIDSDPRNVERSNTLGCPALYGNAANMALLEAAGIARAKAVITTFDNPADTIKLLHRVRAVYRDLPVICRVHRMNLVEDLLLFGATAVFPDSLGASESMRQEIIKSLKLPIGADKEGYRLVQEKGGLS